MIKSLLIGGLLATSSVAIAQERPGPPQVLMVKPLRGGAYWIEGGRANTGFIVGKTSVIVIDAEMSPDMVKQELAAIAKLTDKPISTIIVTHADPDHVAGVPLYPAAARLIEHENTWSEVVASSNDPTGGPLTSVYKRVVTHKPSHTIAGNETVTLDGVRIQLIHIAPAHTSGDLIVYLPAQKIVYAGDVVTTNLGRFPVIHFGGSSLGWIATMKAMLALDATTYVGGHGSLETKAQLEARVHDAEERRAAVKTMVEQGKSLSDVETALPEPGANPMFFSFTRTVFDELTKGYPPASPPWTNIVKH
ncbi:MBL fold metallo-hydrolase [Sphingomonas sp.]|uniref:MBL fold metallo-hydrolase n=1 Tax=Sphingomonas sp. TaxID=28214 RepID=UPI0025F3D3D0|nr:MBL fold metallo-hydrolase [Sphingomonas sp.]